MGASSATLKQRAYRELKEYLLIVAYLWAVFALFTIYKSMILAEHHIDFALHGIALINALALGKIVLVAKGLHLGERFKNAPLIYPTFLKAFSFTVVLVIFKLLEDVGVGYFRGKSLQESIGDLGGGTWRGVLTLTFMLFVVLIPFFAFGELQTLLGEGRLAKLFFNSRDSLNLPSRSDPGVPAHGPTPGLVEIPARPGQASRRAG